MQKITPLAFGIITTIAIVTNVQAAIIPNYSIPISEHLELQAQVRTLTNQSIAPTAKVPKKYKIKYPNYRGFKLEESTKEKVDCQRIVNTANQNQSNVSTSNIGFSSSGKCNAEVQTVPTPPPK